MAELLSELAPAKINLALAVTGRREDGYHLLETLVLFTSFGDRIVGGLAPSDRFAMTGHYGGALSGEAASSNLVMKARDALRDHLLTNGMDAPPVALTLEKNLPVASGIGGGSADAAAALRLLTKLWNVRITPDALASIALKLGADVPMCLESRPLMARGIGEVITPLDHFEELPIVLANPGVSVATPAVFKALASHLNPELPELPDIRNAANMATWIRAARNDLTAPATAIAPKISYCLTAIEQSGALAVAMSGSGATCFGIYADKAKAQASAKEMSKRKPGWFIAATETLV